MKVLVKEKIGDSGIELLRSHGFTVDVGYDWTPEQLGERIGEYEGLLIRSATQVDAALLSKATNLRAVGRAGVGVDNVDVAAATKRGVVVANAPEPDDADRLAGDLDAPVAAAVPGPLLQSGVRLGDVPRLREQEGHRVLRRRDDVRLRRVHDHHAPTGGGLDVDVVEPDARTGDDPQVATRREHVRSHARLGTDHERVVRRDLLGERAGCEVLPDVDLEVLAQQVETSFGEGLRHEDPHGVSFRRRRPRRRPRQHRASPDSPSPRASARGRRGHG